jgi:hypothetical protein
LIVLCLLRLAHSQDSPVTILQDRKEKSMSLPCFRQGLLLITDWVLAWMLPQVTLRNVGLVAARKLKAAISSPLVALGAATPAGAAVAADNTDVWSAVQGEALALHCHSIIRASEVAVIACQQVDRTNILLFIAVLLTLLKDSQPLTPDSLCLILTDTK